MIRKTLYIIALLFVSLQTFAQTYTYDSNNRLTKVVYSNGTTITYTFDALGNRLTKKVTGASSTTYKVTVSATPSGSGTVTGGGTYASGSTVELYANASAGYEFQRWTDGITDNPRTVTVNGKVSYTAQFKESTVTPTLLGDIVADGQINQQDLDALVEAYLNNTPVTKVTDLDSDGSLTIADITKLISLLPQDAADDVVDGQIVMERKYLVNSVNDYYSNATYNAERFGYQCFTMRFDNDVYIEIRYHNGYYWNNSYNSSHLGIFVAVGKSGETEDEWYIAPLVKNEWINEKIVIDNNGTIQYVMNGQNIGTHQFSQLKMDGAKNMTLDINPYGWWYTHYHYMDDLRLTMPGKTVSDNFNDGILDADLWQTPSNPDGVREEGGVMKTEQIRTDQDFHLRSNPISLFKDNNNNIKDGHEYVDLGLPSGTLWATCNVGANSPEDYGGYYAWGETETKSTYNWSSYKWCSGTTCNSSNKTLTKYCAEDGYGTVDNVTVLKKEDDVANVVWGGNWRIPTDTEFQELIDNCTWTIVTVTGASKLLGYTVTGKNGKSIYLPAAGNEEYAGEYGYYWSASLRSNGHSTNANTLEFGDRVEVTGDIRYHGQSIRPVLSNGAVVQTNYINGHEYVDLGLPSGTLWATCNVGASTPEGIGCYYSWGETEGNCEGKNDFQWKNYKWNENLLGKDFTKYCDVSTYGYNGFKDNKTKLELTDDAANSAWKDNWRMPTREDAEELMNSQYTSWILASVNGVTGFTITSIIDGYKGNSIFMPSIGGRMYGSEVSYYDKRALYWTSSLSVYEPDYADVILLKQSDEDFETSYTSRECGLQIRPVISK